MISDIESFKKNLDEIVKSFNAAPFLFVGSGLSRRYLGTPSWNDLLKFLVSKIATDAFSYSMYENQARDKKDDTLNLPKLASVISEDFNAKWYHDESFRTNDPVLCQQVAQGVKPVKAEVAYYIKSFKPQLDRCGAEIDLLKKLCEESISGVITTNYDTFLDELTNYTCYVGQSELLTSPTQGIAEIYKIHGTVDDPKDLIFDDLDYQRFIAKTKYLSAKLLTIFLEYPVVFLGYSISDPNIRSIFEAILDCLDEEKQALLKNRLFFIEYSGDHSEEYDISTYRLLLGKRDLEMTRIRMSDYSLLYKAMQNFQMKIPVRILRHLRQAFFEYTITTQPSATVQAMRLDDVDLKKENILVIIGRSSEMSKYGLQGITADDIYIDLITNNLFSKFQADDILTVIPKLDKGNAKIPKYKYLANAKIEPPADLKTDKKYDDFLCSTVIQTRDKKTMIVERSVNGIRKYNANAPAYYMQFLKEEEMDIDDLESFLIEEFKKNPDVMNKEGGKRSDLRRLIRIYDFLKYKKSHE